MSYIDKINEKEKLKLATAYEIGLEPVDVKWLKNCTEELIFGEWDFYKDIAIRRSQGVEALFHAHWDGEKYSSWLVSLDDDWLLAGQQGERLTSNCVTMFADRCVYMESYFNKLQTMLKNHEYKGYVNISVAFDGKVPKYRDIFFGATEMFEVCLERLYESPVVALFNEKDGVRPVDRKVRGFVGYTRVYSYPYGLTRNKELLDAITCDDKPELFWDADSYVIVGEKSKEIKETWASVYKQIEPLRRFGVCYRIDGDKNARQKFFQLKRGRIL